MACRADLLSDRPDPMVLSDETLTRKMLEAAAPLLAEAWGVTDQERMREQIRQNNQNLLAAASEYYRLAYPEAATKETP
jgi:hypothetical protein